MHSLAIIQCVSTQYLYFPQEMEEPTRVSRGKAGGETFLNKEVINSSVVMAVAMQRGLFPERTKKICEIGRK